MHHSQVCRKFFENALLFGLTDCNLKAQLRTAIAKIGQPLSQSVWHEVENRPALCRAKMGRILNFHKVKVKLSLCLTKHHAMKTIGEWRYSSTHSLTSTLEGVEWPASRPSRFTPRERSPRTPWIGGWVGPRAVLDAVVKRKIPSPCRESNSRTPVVQPVAQRYTDWAIMALLNFHREWKKLFRLLFTMVLV
jgi:hypothetical protein